MLRPGGREDRWSRVFTGVTHIESEATKYSWSGLETQDRCQILFGHEISRFEIWCWAKNESSVCPPGSRVWSPVTSYHPVGPQFGHFDLFLISPLHQCPATLWAIGQSQPHGTLIRLTSSADPNCETSWAFDLSKPMQILTYKQGQHKHHVVRYSASTCSNISFHVSFWCCDGVEVKLTV